MEFAVFFVCMAIIAQINAAPTPDAGTPQYNNEFDLPPMAQKGFNMRIQLLVTLSSDIKHKLKVVMLPDSVNEANLPESCKNIQNSQGKHICIMPNEELLEKSGDSESDTLSVCIKATPTGSDQMRLLMFLNSSYNTNSIISLGEFDKLKHFSVSGTGVQAIQKLEFDFSGNDLCTTESAVDSGQNGVYGTQLNGGSESVPLRPARSTELNMFVIPRALNNGDSLAVTCTINDPNRFTLNLLTGSPTPDYNNVACQIDSDFQANTILVKIIQNGIESEMSRGEANSMMNGTELTFDFSCQERGGSSLGIFVNGSYLAMLRLQHEVENITFLQLKGDVKVTGLNFKYA